MENNISISIYNGPLYWLREEIDNICNEEIIPRNLLDVIDERDDQKRRITYIVEGNTSPESPENSPRLELIFAESSDYASLQEHAITNFTNLIRSLNPRHIVLHNPPSQILKQVERSFHVNIHKYKYPKITRKELKKFNASFSDQVIGQEHAKQLLLAAMYLLTNKRRTKPVILMFYGPSGVGKTETAQFINKLLGGKLMRQQFSMFHNDKFVSYLFGGKHSESSFARDLLDRESGVILIDEFDKTNPIFHGAFYQFFDDGIFVDSNYSVEVGSALIICTSNYETEEEIRRSLGDALYSRFDFLIPFAKLSESDSKKVILKLIENRYEELTQSEKEHLNLEELRQKFLNKAHYFDNVRKLRKIIDETFSISLVRAYLRES